MPDPEDFASRYVAHPWPAYLHMTPGVLYLLGAPVQLSARIRTRYYTLHRRLGRVLVGAGALSVVGVGTIRIWIQVFFGFGLLGFRDSFGVAFWLAFVLHVLAAEWWLRAMPRPAG